MPNLRRLVMESTRIQRNALAWQRAALAAEALRKRIVGHALQGEAITQAITEALFDAGESEREDRKAWEARASRYIADGVENIAKVALADAFRMYKRLIPPP